MVHQSKYPYQRVIQEQDMEQMETTPICKHCRTRPVAEGDYCAECVVELAHDMLEGDIMAAYEQKVISKEECQFFFGGAAGPLTEADEKRFAQIMKKIDGCE